MKRALGLLVLLGCDVSRPTPVRFSTETCRTIAGETEAPIQSDVRCSPVFCSAAISQTACRVRVTSTCEPQLLEGTIDDAGMIAFDGGCRGIVATSEPFLSIDCLQPTCTIDLYHAAAGTFTSTSITVVDQPFQSERGSNIQPLDGFDPLTGYLTGIAVMDDRIAISAHDVYQGVRCRATEPTRIALIDRRTLAILEPGVGPPCLTALGAIGPDRFVGLHRGAALTVFDDRGTTLATIPLLDDPELDPLDLIVDRDAMRAHALFGNGSECRLAAIDLAAMTATVSGFLTGHRRAIAYDGDHNVLIADRVQAQIETFHAETLQQIASLGLFFAPRMIADDSGAMLTSGSTLLVSTTGLNGGIWVATDMVVRTTAIFYQENAVPWATVLDGEEAAAVALMTPMPDFRTLIARFDLTTGTFVPGATEIGRGYVRSLVRDRDGDLWALLPWSGSLVRLRR